MNLLPCGAWVGQWLGPWQRTGCWDSRTWRIGPLLLAALLYEPSNLLRRRAFWSSPTNTRADKTPTVRATKSYGCAGRVTCSLEWMHLSAFGSHRFTIKLVRIKKVVLEHAPWSDATASEQGSMTASHAEALLYPCSILHPRIPV